MDLRSDLVFYSGRHTFGTDMMEQSGNLALAGKLMGHSSPITTMRYLHPEITAAQALVDKRNRERDGIHAIVCVIVRLRMGSK